MLKAAKKLFIGISLAGISFTLIQPQLESKNIFTRIGKGTVRAVKCAILGDNFHAVESNTLYRSRQLSPERLDYYMKKYGIKTVINLRGKQGKREWWQEEQQVVKHNNGLLFNIDMNARVITPLDKLNQLGAILLAAPKPMLVHCYAGSDRTGEACAIWALLNGCSVKDASKHLTLRYGHTPFVFPRKRELIKNFDIIYPSYITDMLALQPQNRFSVDELNELDTQDLLIKLQEHKS